MNRYVHKGIEFKDIFPTCHSCYFCNIKYTFSLGANIKQLAAVALSKLQREIAKDGREPSFVSKGMQEKYFSRMASVFNSSKMPRGMK